MDVTEAIMINLPLNFVNGHSHCAEEHVSAKNRQLIRNSYGTLSGKKDDELRQDRAEMLPASDSELFTALGHHRGRLHSAGAQLDYVR
jgi:hypothetical protein